SEHRRLAACASQLAALLAERTWTLEPVRFRPVPTELMDTEQMQRLWVPCRGMYGGFTLSVHRGRLVVESWGRVAGGSGQAHVITESGCVLVEEGFVWSSRLTSRCTPGTRRARRSRGRRGPRARPCPPR